jgi:hypothetical protein
MACRGNRHSCYPADQHRGEAAGGEKLLDHHSMSPSFIGYTLIVRERR